MDIFRALSGGGARFDKRRFKDDVQLFSPSASTSKTALDGEQPEEASNSGSTIVPRELDFFGSAAKSGTVSERAGGDAKGKGKATDDTAAMGQKRKRQDESAAVVDAEPSTSATLSPYLKAHKLKLTGTDVPLPLASWGELETRWKVGKWLTRNLEKEGWGEPTPIQRGSMSVLLDNRDLLAGAPTGSGKTLAFLLPIIHHLRAPAKEGFRAAVVSPTRELAIQIHDQLRRLSEGRKFRICVLTKASESTMKQDPALRKKFDILITTPLRLVHAIEQEEVDLTNVQHLVLDEADRLLEAGFLDQTDSILAACSHPNLRKALFSATLPAGVEEMAKTFMVDECRVIVGTKDAATETIQQSLKFVGSEDGKLHALRALIQEGGLKPPALLFVQSIQRAQELFHELVYDGLHVDVIHSERPRAQRERVVSAFKKGDVWVLICTELMARGIDFKGVQLVVNYDFPQTVQSYIHRIGRTGRAGRPGRAITYFTREDAPYLKTIVNVMRQSGCEVSDWLLKLPNPSKQLKKNLRRRPVERKDIRAAGSGAVGRKDAQKRKDMVEGSKRRKIKNAEAAQKGASAKDGAAPEKVGAEQA